MTNNIILRKLKIALNLRDEGMLEILALAGVRLSKHELSAFFLRPDHPHYRKCQDQVLRGFLKGMGLNTVANCGSRLIPSLRGSVSFMSNDKLRHYSC